jgi:membrane peptidoglycan carboxypeptidase
MAKVWAWGGAARPARSGTEPLGSARRADPGAVPTGRSRRRTAWVVSILLLGAVVGLEARTSWLQSWLFAAVARRMTFGFVDAPGSATRYPSGGPYDIRLGYARLPEYLERLGSTFRVTRQARLSPAHRWLVDMGVFPIYDEKTQAGLRVLDRRGRALFAADYPQRVYDGFGSIPPLVVRTLLFIENRELLDESHPRRNPAVEWDRLARAMLEKGVEPLRPSRRVPGGSTLATQLEKLRHSPGGRTETAQEKLRQMLSASLRAYQRGEETIAARREIFLEYTNSLPLAASTGFGEVHGLGDGLWAWFGTDLSEANRLLGQELPDDQNPEIEARARVFRQVLALCLAQRRPAYYLLRDSAALTTLSERYLRLVHDEGVISDTLFERALAAPVVLRDRAPATAPMSLVWKPIQGVRTRLASALGASGLYELDRLDLSARTTFDRETQSAVLGALHELHDPGLARKAGLLGEHLLGAGDPSQVVYSFTLYEHVGDANLLRVQADTYDEPLNINEAVKLELGSTAKLRTLVTYLEIVAALHAQYASEPSVALVALDLPKTDKLARWATDYLAHATDRGLPRMLEAAMERRYSANPGEAFFTGGGRHVFQNFDRSQNAGSPTVREAFRQSINLPFIRVMRDVVQYYTLRVPGSSARILEDVTDPRRQQYLERFADTEGRAFLRRFYVKHHGQNAEEALSAVLVEVGSSPRRVAAVLRFARPTMEFDTFASTVRGRSRDSLITESTLHDLYDSFDPGRFGLADQGYLAGIHPLRLWLLEYLGRRPDATFDEVVTASAAERQAVYTWLFSARRKNAQDQRIRTLLEVEAFLEIHRAWKRLGYPFESLVPSYATAIGSSADRPAALAELVGIVLADGVRYPTARVDELLFAANTPYETTLVRKDEPGERVLPSAVAARLRRELIGVVEQGTARRLDKAAVLHDGSTLAMGGKTGTGDNRREIFGRRGRVIESRAVNRTATFVFFLGDRFFGTITSYVPGPQADDYEFTSSLSLQVLKYLLPQLMPLVDAPAPDAAPTELRAAS